MVFIIVSLLKAAGSLGSDAARVRDASALRSRPAAQSIGLDARLKLDAPAGQKPLCGGERGRSRFRAGSEAFKGRHSRTFFDKVAGQAPVRVPAPAGAAKCLQMFSFCGHCRHSPENALGKGSERIGTKSPRMVNAGSGYCASRAQQQSRSRELLEHKRCCWFPRGTEPVRRNKGVNRRAIFHAETHSERLNLS